MHKKGRRWETYEDVVDEEEKARQLKESLDFVNARRVAHEAKPCEGIQYELMCQPLNQ